MIFKFFCFHITILAEEVDLSEGIAWKKSGKSQFYKYSEDMDGSSAISDPRCNSCGMNYNMYSSLILNGFNTFISLIKRKEMLSC